MGLSVPRGVIAKNSNPAEEGDPEVIALMHEMNEQLSARGLNVLLVQLEFFTIGPGRPIDRILQAGERWVAYDTRRSAQDDDITYLVDQSDGATSSGLTHLQTEAAIDEAMATWDNSRALRKVDVVKRVDSGADPDILDWLLGFDDDGIPGDSFLADIVHAGWLPREFFDALRPPKGGEQVLATSATWIFVDSEEQPTDINGDQYFDTAFNEVYYNDYWGDPEGDPRFPWGIDVDYPPIDVETIALHESGHSLGMYHFGPPPDAIMNVYFYERRQSLYPIDIAGMSAIWKSWPK